MDKANTSALNNMTADQYDELTGMPKMSYFFDLAVAWKEEVQKKGGQPVLLYLNFKGLKFYNMKHGFVGGDRMLRQFAELLKQAFGVDSCCHISADHFSVYTEEQGLEEHLKGIFRAWQAAAGSSLPVHVGIYRGTEEKLHISVALDMAKLACNTLTDSYVSRYCFYTKEMSDAANEKQYIIENIDRAISEGWIKVYLQPIIRAVNEQVCDAEALARWIDPEKGFLSPASFIPALEEAGLIYKLDLYMLDQVLASMKTLLDQGYAATVPHSINLSRSDFEACDIVEEIRKRVDDAGIKRDQITIEITESVVGRDFAYMKEQVERFRKLGFPVWMDDFGSGYSSLGVLQNIRFDLLKFDMSFMRRFDEGEEGRVLLTELMRMATAMGLDTVCEGVETEEQVRFLQEIGCSKLQGFYYSKPRSPEELLEMFKDGGTLTFEDPKEACYFESIGRVNLFDLGVIASGDEYALQNAFSTIPIAILEFKEDAATYLRSNRSYQDFMKRFFSSDILDKEKTFKKGAVSYGNTFIAVMKSCCEGGTRTFFDERMPDGSVIHGFVHRINVNPVTGSTAVAVAVLSITSPNDEATYGDIAKALVADFYNFFVIDLDTEHYIEYSSRAGSEELSVERHGEGFFASARRDTMSRIFEEDREAFLREFTKEHVIRELDTHGFYAVTYRLIDTGEPIYVSMKITRLQGGNRVILGVRNIDVQMRHEEEEQRLREERISLGRIASLSSDYIVLYAVDPETGHYTQYSPTAGFEKIDLATQGEDFFADVVTDAPKVIAPEDMEHHLATLTKENMMRSIREKGYYIYKYRFLLNGAFVSAVLRAALVKEDDEEKIILGVRKFDPDEDFETVRSNSRIFSHIARALARGYTDLYYVNMETDELIEYYTDDDRGVLTEKRRSADFFEGCPRDAKLYVHPEDQEKFVRAMNRDFLKKALEKEPEYRMTYRRIKDGRTFYVEMKVSRVEDDWNYIVLAVSDIDELMQKHRAEEQHP